MRRKIALALPAGIVLAMLALRAPATNTPDVAQPSAAGKTWKDIVHAQRLKSDLWVKQSLFVDGYANFNGGLRCDSNKFTVADSTGAVLAAGLASLNGGIAVDTDNFTVSGTTGAAHSEALISSDTGLQAGKAASAGTVTIYPATTASGKTTFTCVDNAGDTTTNINFAAQSGARTYTVPDAGESASFAMSEGDQTLDGTKTFSDAVPSDVGFQAGKDGSAGTVTIYPATSGRGKATLAAADNTGDTTTAIVVGAQSGARTYTVTDVGGSAYFVMTQGAQTVEGAKTFTSAVASDTGLQAGKDASAGTVTIYPATTASGKTTVTSADNAGDTTTNINVAAQAGARTYTVPDAGASASFAMTQGAQSFAGKTTLTGGLVMPSGAAGMAGQQALTSGTATVSTTAAGTGSLVFLTLSGAKHADTVAYSVGTITDGTSFVINALVAAGTVNTGSAETVNWLIVNPK